jgi:hypothetical protein
MATFNITRHVKLSIALAIIFDNGFGSRRGLSPRELLVLDAENTIKAILPIGQDASTGWEFVARADIVREFAKLGVVLK